MRKFKTIAICAMALLLSMNALGQMVFTYEPIMFDPSSLNCNAISGFGKVDRWAWEATPEPLTECNIGGIKPERSDFTVGFFSEQTAAYLWPYREDQVEFVPNLINWSQRAIKPIIECTNNEEPDSQPIPFHLQWTGLIPTDPWAEPARMDPNEPFMGNDCVCIMPGGDPVTINFASADNYDELYILGTSIGSNSNLQVTVTYTDGTTQSGRLLLKGYNQGNEYDAQKDAVRFAWQDGDKPHGGGDEDGDAWLYPEIVMLEGEVERATKLFKSITFQYVTDGPSCDNCAVAIFAITGRKHPWAPTDPFFVYSTSQSNPAKTTISIISTKLIGEDVSFTYDVATDENFTELTVENASLTGTKNGNQFISTINDKDYSNYYIRVRAHNEYGISKARIATKLYEPLQNLPITMEMSCLNHNGIAGANDELATTKLDDYAGFYSSEVATNNSWGQQWIDKALKPEISIPSGIGDISIPFNLLWEGEAEFDGKDCVRLTKDNNTANISFENPEAYSFLYMCGTAGNVTGGCIDVDVTITYIDNTSKSTTLTYYDWYPGFTPANGKLFARQTGSGPDETNGGPYVYALPLNDALDAKLPIKSIHVESDEESELVAGIFGFSGVRNGNAPQQPEYAYAYPHNDYTLQVCIASVTQDIAGNPLDNVDYYCDIARDEDFTDLYKINQWVTSSYGSEGEVRGSISVSEHRAYENLYFRIRAVNSNGASASQTIELYDQYKRDLTTGQYGTFCFNRTPLKILNGSFYTIAYYDEAANQIAIDPVEVEDIKAGVPYIIGTSVQWMYDPKSNPVEMSEEDQNGLHGTYTGISPTDFECHMLANTEDGPLFKKAAIGSSLPAYRAYLMLEEISTSPATPSKAGRRFIGMPNGTPTELICTKTNASAKKVFINNQFMIIKDGEKYNAQGIRMQ